MEYKHAPYVMRGLVRVRTLGGGVSYFTAEQAIMRAYRRGRTRVHARQAKQVLLTLVHAICAFLLTWIWVYYLLWCLGY